MFKQSQAVRRSESQLFLKAPNTYAIRFLTAKEREHGYLPKIKECALTGFSITILQMVITKHTKTPPWLHTK